MITVAICDDDVAYLRNVLFKSVLLSAQKAKIEVDVKLFSNGEKLLKEYENGILYDIIILDINMPHMNGKELAGQLRLIDNSFFLVFVTSYDAELINTVRYRINAFISKHSDNEKIETELVRVFNEYSFYNPQYEVFKILEDGLPSTRKIALNNVMGFYFTNKIMYVKTSKQDYILQEKVFRKMVNRYLQMGFFECCRNYLVNIKRIEEIKDNKIIFDNGDEFPVSIRNRKALVKKFTEFIMGEVSD